MCNRFRGSGASEAKGAAVAGGGCAGWVLQEDESAEGGERCGGEERGELHWCIFREWRGCGGGDAGVGRDREAYGAMNVAEGGE